MTGQDVLDKIEAFSEGWEWDRAYSFAHIVLGDMNLGDRHILYCLSDELVNEWFTRCVESIPEDNEYAMDYDYEIMVNEVQLITDFLIELLNTPKPIRDEVESLYVQAPNI